MVIDTLKFYFFCKKGQREMLFFNSPMKTRFQYRGSGNFVSLLLRMVFS